MTQKEFDSIPDECKYISIDPWSKEEAKIFIRRDKIKRILYAMWYMESLNTGQEAKQSYLDAKKIYHII